MSPVELNAKAVVTATLVGVAALYLLYSFYPRASSMSRLKEHLTWKTKAMVDIPSDLKERAKSIKIIDRRETINVEGEEVPIFYRQADPPSQPKFPILLLHGMAFTSATWVDKVQSPKDPHLNTVNLLAAAGYQVIAVDLPVCGANIHFHAQMHPVFYRETFPKAFATENRIPLLLLHGAHSDSSVWLTTRTIRVATALGYRVVALDLPGWGQSKASLKEPQRTHFLESFIKQTKIHRPVIVSPSMSGGFSLPYIMGDGKDGGYTCGDRVRGYVPVAPVGTDTYSNAQYSRCEVPVMIVYGTKDVHLGLTSTGNLRNFGNNEIFPMKDAKHPCYLDNPDEWHYYLYNFLLAVEREEGDSRQM